MANYDKWTKGAAGHLCKHFERAKDDQGEYIKFGNRDIDTSRTHLNYNLAPERKSQYGFIADRCKELHCLNRKDVNVLASWVVTAPEGMPDDKLKDFFNASYKALEKKYGKDNVVSAYVHMDESGRPHMHFAFVPVVWDKKKEAWKVSAKQCVTRTDLQKFHPWLEAELKSQLDFDVKIMNEATKDGNKTITELKRERELQKQAEIAKQTEEAKNALQKLEEPFKNSVSVYQLQDTDKVKKTLLGRPKSVVRPYEKDKEIVDGAMRCHAVQSLKANLEYTLERTESENADLKDELRKERVKNHELKQEVERLKPFEVFVQQLNLLQRFKEWFKERQQRRELERSQRESDSHHFTL